MGGATKSEVGGFFARRHEIELSLGEGDGNRTYLARDRKMERHVGLSLVKEEATDADPEGTEREANVLGRIGSNANIVSLYDYEIDPASSVQYMVFQYLGNGTLAEHLRATGPLFL
jgi:serine/threonine protein kinase